MSKHKYTIGAIREALERYLDDTNCCRTGGRFLSIQGISKGKRFFTLKHRSHVEYGHKKASKVGHGSATCNVFYDLFDVANLPEGTLNSKNSLLTLKNRWCEAHELAVEKKIAKILDAEA